MLHRFPVGRKHIESLPIPVKAPEKDTRENDCTDDEEMQIRAKPDRAGLIGFADRFHSLLGRFHERDGRGDLFRVVCLDKLRRAESRRTGGCLAVGAKTEREIDVALVFSGANDQRFTCPVKAAGTPGADGVGTVERVVIHRKTHTAPAVDALRRYFRRKTVHRVGFNLDHLAYAHVVFRGGGDDQRPILCKYGIGLRIVGHGIPPVRDLRRGEVRVG